MPACDFETVHAPMPGLENLRKQAKTLLRRHRERHVPVAPERRATLPRLAALDERAVLDAPLKLADTLDAVARRAGFTGWQALLKETADMPRTEPAPAMAPRIAATEAMVTVADFARARAFYVERLGFELEFAYGEPPYYGLVKRDAARLCLRLVCEPVYVGDVREREELLSGAFTLASATEIEVRFQTYEAAGVPFFKRLVTEPWGARTFILRDPDGNLILFAAPGA